MLNILYETIKLRNFFFKNILQIFLSIEQSKTKNIKKNYYNKIVLPFCGTLDTGIVFPFIIDGELEGGAILIETSVVINWWVDDIGVCTWSS